MEAGRAEVRAVIERARHRRGTTGEPTIFFLDEIHRFNKAQQDALLPAVEDGLVTLIGATTENPYFEVNSALLSRAQRVRARGAQPRRRADAARSRPGARRVRRRSRRSPRRRSSSWPSAPAATRAPRSTALELACEARRVRRRSSRSPTPRTRCSAVRCSTTARPIATTTRSRPGSRPPAARTRRLALLPGGDARGRRGPALHRPADGRSWPPRTSATPTRRRSSVATAAAHAVEHVGLPECQFALAQAAIYLSLAPKSDAAKRAVFAARGHIREHGASAPPAHLRSSTRSDGELRQPPPPARAPLAAGAAARRGDRGALLRARRGRGRAARAAGGDPARGGGRAVTPGFTRSTGTQA